MQTSIRKTTATHSLKVFPFVSEIDYTCETDRLRNTKQWRWRPIAASIKKTRHLREKYTRVQTAAKSQLNTVLNEMFVSWQEGTTRTPKI